MHSSIVNSLMESHSAAYGECQHSTKRILSDILTISTISDKSIKGIPPTVTIPQYHSTHYDVQFSSNYRHLSFSHIKTECPSTVYVPCCLNEEGYHFVTITNPRTSFLSQKLPLSEFHTVILSKDPKSFDKHREQCKNICLRNFYFILKENEPTPVKAVQYLTSFKESVLSTAIPMEEKKDTSSKILNILLLNDKSENDEKKLVKFLQQFPIFQKKNPNLLLELMRRVEILDLSPMTELIRPNEPLTSIYIILQGEVHEMFSNCLEQFIITTKIYRPLTIINQLTYTNRLFGLGKTETQIDRSTDITLVQHSWFICVNELWPVIENVILLKVPYDDYNDISVLENDSLINEPQYSVLTQWKFASCFSLNTLYRIAQMSCLICARNSSKFLPLNKNYKVSEDVDKHKIEQQNTYVNIIVRGTIGAVMFIEWQRVFHAFAGDLYASDQKPAIAHPLNINMNGTSTEIDSHNDKLTLTGKKMTKRMRQFTAGARRIMSNPKAGTYKADFYSPKILFKLTENYMFLSSKDNEYFGFIVVTGPVQIIRLKWDDFRHCIKESKFCEAYYQLETVNEIMIRLNELAVSKKAFKKFHEKHWRRMSELWNPRFTEVLRK